MTWYVDGKPSLTVNPKAFPPRKALDMVAYPSRRAHGDCHELGRFERFPDRQLWRRRYLVPCLHGHRTTFVSTRRTTGRSPLVRPCRPPHCQLINTHQEIYYNKQPYQFPRDSSLGPRTSCKGAKRLSVSVPPPRNQVPPTTPPLSCFSKSAFIGWCFLKIGMKKAGVPHTLYNPLSIITDKS